MKELEISMGDFSPLTGSDPLSKKYDQVPKKDFAHGNCKAVRNPARVGIDAAMRTPAIQIFIAV